MPDKMKFLCECNSKYCREMVEISLGQFGEIRSWGKVAILSKACETSVTEPVIAEFNDFIVVGARH